MDAGDCGCQEGDAADNETFQGVKQKLIQPASLKDPKLAELKEALVNWINRTLKPEHIVVQCLEEDLYDGLVLHHLLSRLAGVHVSVEEIAMTRAAQLQKLDLVLEELHKQLGLQDTRQIKWSVKLIHNKDILATIHLLVAMVRRFKPELDLPPNVKVEVVNVEVSVSGIRSDVQMEVLTEQRAAASESLSNAEEGDPINQLLNLEAHEVNAVKQDILQFVNQTLSPMGLQVVDVDKQFADGVILLLLIGQLEGFFIPLHNFSLTPVNSSEMLHNVTLALDILTDTGLHISGVDPQDVISQDVAATLRLLHALFKKHK